MHAADASAPWEEEALTHLHLDFNTIYCRNDESRHTDVFLNAAQRFHQSCCYRAGGADVSTRVYHTILSNDERSRPRARSAVTQTRTSGSQEKAELLGPVCRGEARKQTVKMFTPSARPPHHLSGLTSCRGRCGVSNLPSHSSSMFVLNSLVSVHSPVSCTSPYLHRCATRKTYTCPLFILLSFCITPLNIQRLLYKNKNNQLI